MIDRILIGIDFSPSSIGAARWACRFLHAGGRAVLVHVVEGGAWPPFLRGIAPDSGAGDTPRRLAEIADGLGCDTSTEVVAGQSARALADAGARVDAGMLAIGPRGSRASRFGTTAEQLVRASDRPVLVVRDAPDAAPRRILAAVDESAMAERVLALAARAARHFDARATVLHALPPDLLAALKAARPGSPEREGAEAATTATERWLRDGIAAAGLEHADVVAPFGSPAHEIISRTGADAHDLVIMGSRGVGAVEREVFGSVASQVLRGAWCPVVVV